MEFTVHGLGFAFFFFRHRHMLASPFFLTTVRKVADILSPVNRHRRQGTALSAYAGLLDMKD
jgi:hypothetical protein